MATLRNKLPPYCVIKARKDYAVVYFQVPERLRPERWKPAHLLGRTDQDTHATIIKRGEELYAELLAIRKDEDLKIERGAPKGSLADVITQYMKGEHWEVLRPETRKGYLQNLKVIGDWSVASRHSHMKDLKAPAIMAFLSRWRETPRTRKQYKVMLSILFEQAIELGYVGTNPMRDIRLPKSLKPKRKLVLWEEEHITQFLKTADANGAFNLGSAVLIAFESGQRQFDIISFSEPHHYSNGRFVFMASKTGKPVNIRATDRLRERLAKRPKTQMMLTINDATGKVWDKDAISHKFRDIAILAGLPDHQFRQLRNSSAIHADRAGLDDAEFESVYGWPKERVRMMMREYYGDRDQTVADRGVTKLEEYRKSEQKRVQQQK